MRLSARKIAHADVDRGTARVSEARFFDVRGLVGPEGDARLGGV